MPHLQHASGLIRAEANETIGFSARDGKVVLTITAPDYTFHRELVIPRAEWEDADSMWRSVHEFAEQQQGYIDEGDLG